MKLRTIIIEGKKSDEESLNHKLDQCRPSVEVLMQTHHIPEAIEAIEKHDPDLVFLDVEHFEGSGLEHFECFSKPNFALVFITAYDRFTLKAFKCAAIRCLLKPIDTKGLEEVLNNIQERKRLYAYKNKFEVLKENFNKLQERLVLPTKEGYSFIALKNILYCKANGNYTSFYLLDENNILVSKTLKIYSDMLTEFNFFRANKSYLVNINHIQKYSRAKNPAITMRNNAVINISVYRRGDFLDCIKRIL